MGVRSALLLLAILGAANLPAIVNGTAGRHARNLVFPGVSGRVQLVIGFGIPVSLPHQAVTMGVVLKSNYLTPSNATQYTRPLEAFSQRGARAAGEAPQGAREVSEAPQGACGSSLTAHLPSRWHMYSALQDAVEQLGAGAGSGRQCLLRAVCEAAAFTVRHDGLLGELVHVLLTPSATRDPVLRHDDYEFHAAEQAGRKARAAQDAVDACGRLFGGCSGGSLDLFTRIQDINFVV